MESRYFYTDARGARTGPFTESELERLAEIGSVDWAGSIELEGLGRSWKVTEVGWLADAMVRSRNRRRPVIEGTAIPVEEPDAAQAPGPAPDAAPPAAAASAEPSAEPSPGAAPSPGAEATPGPAPTPWPPLTPPTMPSAAPLGAPAPTEAACSRATYILLGLLPAFFGIFGIHNIVAGHSRGIVQLILSLATFGGVFGLVVAAPCCCIGVPVWLALFAWTLVDVLTVTRDGRGVALR